MAKKILIADDEEMIRDVVKLALKNEGYEIYEAKDGVEALNVAKDIKPDLVLLDVTMPGKVGYIVSQELKDNPDTKHAYIIFITARGSKAEDAAMDSGGDETISKPFDIVKLRERVRNALKG